MSKSFFENRKTKTRGEGRELYKTPIKVIQDITKSLLDNFPVLKEYIWIDPCAYDGRWEQVFRSFGLESYSFDIKPMGPTVKYKNFLTDHFLEFHNKKIFFIGNPPYSMVNKFIDRALSLTNICYFLGGSLRLTGKISNQVELLHRFEGFEGNQKDLRSKIEFETTNNEKVLVWTCGALVGANTNLKTFIHTQDKVGFAVSPVARCIPDNRVKVINK